MLRTESVRENKNGPDRIFLNKNEFPVWGNKIAWTDSVQKILASQEPIEIHIGNQSKFINFNSGCSTQPFNSVFEYYQSRGLASELKRQQGQGSSILAVVIIFALVYG